MFKPAIVILLLLLAAPLRSEERRRGFWRASVAALAAATIGDTYTSLERRENNPLLRSPDGRFRIRGMAIKGAITGGAIAAQWVMLRRTPQAEPVAATANFAVALIVTGVAGRNHRTSPR